MEKGYISVGFTVWCGLCARWMMAPFEIRNKRETAAHFKKGGWRLTRKHGWVCWSHNEGKIDG